MQRRKEPYGEDGLVTMLIPARAVPAQPRVTSAFATLARRVRGPLAPLDAGVDL